MGYEIKQTFLSGLPKLSYRYGHYEGVVAHSTATPEADNDAELRYFQNNWKTRQAFAHFFVDWDSIYQHADTDYKCWASGNGNSRFVQVELCETADATKFAESYKRYTWLLAKLLFDSKLGVEFGKTLVTHEWVSHNLGGTNHIDPTPYLKSKGITIGQLSADVKEQYTLLAKPADGRIGTVKVTASVLNVRDKADASGNIVGQVKEGEEYKAYDLVRGWYNVGAGWVSGNYVEFKGI